jgi:hypothetical protein
VSGRKSDHCVAGQTFSTRIGFDRTVAELTAKSRKVVAHTPMWKLMVRSSNAHRRKRVKISLGGES